MREYTITWVSMHKNDEPLQKFIHRLKSMEPILHSDRWSFFYDFIEEQYNISNPNGEFITYLVEIYEKDGR